MRGVPMSFEAMAAELARWRFLPDWRFRLHRCPPMGADMGAGFGGLFEAPVLETRATLLDSRTPDTPRMIPIRMVTPVPFYVTDPDSFAVFLRDTVHHAMLHEADEWLQRDGVLVFDPHAQRPAAVGGLPRVGPSER